MRAQLDSLTGWLEVSGDEGVEWKRTKQGLVPSVTDDFFFFSRPGRRRYDVDYSLYRQIKDSTLPESDAGCLVPRSHSHTAREQHTTTSVGVGNVLLPVQ